MVVTVLGMALLPISYYQLFREKLRDKDNKHFDVAVRQPLQTVQPSDFGGDYPSLSGPISLRSIDPAEVWKPV